MRTGSPFVVRGAHRPCQRALSNPPRGPRSSAPRTTGHAFRSPGSPVQRRATVRRPPVRRPPVRLRYLLALGLAWWLLGALVPRARAYWQLHSAATHFANYGLCMVGPTGPGLLRDRPEEFWRLVRRRLVAADPETRPFRRCADSLDAFEPKAGRRRAHLAMAREFAEHAPFASVAPAELGLEDLAVTTALLERLGRESGLLARAGYASLVRPSRNARSAPHPTQTPKPGLGRGLPASGISPAALFLVERGLLLATGRDANLTVHASHDGGLSWLSTRAEVNRVAARAGACFAGRGATAFRLARDGGARMRLESWVRGELETSFPVASAERRLVSFSCDQDAALIATSSELGDDLALRVCREAQRCSVVPLPPELAAPSPQSALLSFARIRGVTVLSLSRAGIVRVVSSRDDGETWAPFTVAYDAVDHGDGLASEMLPSQLVALDRRLLLVAASRRRGQAYPVLVSDDFGASWRSGDDESAPSLARRSAEAG